MTTQKFSRPTKSLPLCTDDRCENGWFHHRGSSYPCRTCSEYEDHELRCRQFKVDPETLLSLPIPEGYVVLWRPLTDKSDVCNGLRFEKPERMTSLLVDGFEFVAHDIYYKRDEGFLDANPHLQEMPSEDSEESTEEEIVRLPDLAFSREDIENKINEHHKYLDHAFALLGKVRSQNHGQDFRFQCQ